MPDGHRATVLNVNDDEATRYIVTRVLTQAGYEVWEACSGTEALEMAQRGPDVMVLDVHLPDMTGFDVSAQLKSQPATAAISILHLSATYVQPSDRAHGLDLGADAYLVSPVDPGELIATVRALLRIHRAEETARQAAAQWKTTFDAITDGVWLLDNGGRVQQVNAAMLALLERSPDDVLGIPADALLREVCGLDSAEALAGVAGKGSSVPLEVRCGDRWLRISSDPVRDGPNSGWVQIISDVTGRKQADLDLRASEEKFRLLVEGVKDYAVFMMDPEGRVVSWNTGAARLIGYTEEEIVGQSFSRFFISEDVGNHTPERELFVASAEGRAEDERWHVRADGSLFWASGVTTPLLDEAGSLRGFAKVIQDATERKHLEEALEQRAQDLELADRRKDEFLAMLAHELRNPLGVISNSLHVLGITAAPNPQEQRLRDTVVRQVTHLTRLVDDLLDVSRITRGKIELRKEDVDLRPLVEHAVQTVRDLVDDRAHTLTLELPPHPVAAYADPTRVEQIVSNLVHNAAKYTEAGGAISVHLRPDGALAGSRGGSVEIEVRDTGIGIAPEMLPRIFDLFAQVDQSLDRSRGGLGIGLTLVRNLVRMHGGEITAYSDGPGRGSRFVVRLPLVNGQWRGAREEVPVSGGPGVRGEGRGVSQLPADRPALATDDPRIQHPTPNTQHLTPNTGSPQAVAPTSILVVEDNADARETMRDLLELLGYKVEIARTGREGLAVALQRHPRVALIDIGLPEMDGYEVAKQIRASEGPGFAAPGHSPLLAPEARPAATRIFLIALTGYGQEEDRRRALEAGFDAHLVKPVDPDELTQFLAKV